MLFFARINLTPPLILCASIRDVRGPLPPLGCIALRVRYARSDPPDVASFVQHVVFFSQSNLKMSEVYKKPRQKSVSLNKKIKAMDNITTNGIHASQIGESIADRRR